MNSVHKSLTSAGSSASSCTHDVAVVVKVENEVVPENETRRAGDSDHLFDDEKGGKSGIESRRFGITAEDILSTIVSSSSYKSSSSAIANSIIIKEEGQFDVGDEIHQELIENYSSIVIESHNYFKFDDESFHPTAVHIGGGHQVSSSEPSKNIHRNLSSVHSSEKKPCESLKSRSYYDSSRKKFVDITLEDILSTVGSSSFCINSTSAVESSFIIEEEDPLDIGEKIHEELNGNYSNIVTENQKDLRWNVESFPPTAVQNEEKHKMSRFKRSTNFHRTLSSVHFAENPLYVSPKPRTYYDSSRIKLVDVCVILNDLFSIVIHGRPKIPLRKHINSKLCLCIFCTGQFKLEKVIGKHAEINYSVKVVPSSANSHPPTQASEGAFACTHCPAQFKLNNSLLKHLVLHPSERLFSCVLCKDMFNYEWDLKEHLLRHSDDRQISGAQCSAVFRRKSTLKAQQLIRINEKPFSCASCPFKFRHKVQLQRHMAVHTRQTPFSCSFCASKFASRRSMTNHYLMFHNDEELESFSPRKKSFSCEQCGKKFWWKHELSSHLLLHNTDKPFFCAHCPEKFNSRGQLRLHLDEHSCISHTCTYCGKSFRKKSTLSTHMMVHTNIKSHRCPHCPSKFKIVTYLRRHLAVHSNDRPFSCVHCPGKFKQKTTLNSHYRSNHSNEFMLQRHMRIPTPN